VNVQTLALLSLLSIGCASHQPSIFGDSADPEGADDQGTGDAPVGTLPAPQWDDVPPDASEGGIGTLEVAGRTDLTAQLDLAAVSVSVTPRGSMAAFEVEHRFDNPTDDVLEGTFRFALPHGAIVTGLAMDIDGKLMEGEVVDRDKAREIYESIVDQMQDPALLEWDKGRAMKLRVFPIEPHAHKRVVIRYLAPLSRVRNAGDEAPHWQVVVPTAAPMLQGTIGRLTVAVDGKVVRDDRDVAAQGTVRAPLTDYAVAAVEQQSDRHGHFTAVTLDPDWSHVAVVPRDDRPRRLAVVVDTSRSALESWSLSRESLRVALGALRPTDEFCVLASDLTVRGHAPGFVSATPGHIEAAMAFLDGIEPDGASDLHAALTEVGSRLRAAKGERLAQVLYVGDGVPTWGETQPAALADHAGAMLAGAPLFAMVFGRDASGELLERLAGTSGGRIARPDSEAGVEWFTGFLEVAPKLRRLRDVTLEVPDGEHEVVRLAATTIFEGQSPTAYVRTAAGAAAPRRLIMRGRTREGLVEQEFDLTAAVATEGVRKRWAAEHIGRLQTDKARKAEVVTLSEEHGVLSRYTSFLVLESEEAYKEHQIERRREAERQADGPSVSGGDLGEASLRPGDIQPGDPEILIPAPEDARSVTVVFPFGETKSARWDAATGKWVVRFLIDEDTEPGVYEVDVRIVHADGTIERIKAQYTVDTRAPAFTLSLRATKDGGYILRADQVVADADRDRERVGGLAAPLSADVDPDSFDARRVEAQLPDGQTLQMTRHPGGVFDIKWMPRSDVQWPAEIEVVTMDRALNTSRIVQELSPRGR
jgi:hypothetical protein